MLKPWKISSRKATYILRYFLPRPPYVTAEVEDRRLEELMAFCQHNGMDAVMFYVNFRPDWYYMPDSPDHARAWAREMTPIVAKIRKAGLSYQLNFQDLLGAHSGGVDLRPHFPWEYLVDQHGNINQGCACPIGPKFRTMMGQQLQAWAATKPDVIWIDDDFRLHNHQTYRSEMDWYCFCPNHLTRFQKKLGRKLSRETLIQEVLLPGSPGKTRLVWLEFLNETMAETARWISQQIHDVSPHTRVAQMTSHPDVHSVEGRHWGNFLKNLSGDLQPITRPTFGPYAEYGPQPFYACYLQLDQMKVNISTQYSGKVDFCPELENTRFTRWSKSAAATQYQLILSQLIGCPGITLSLYDLEGSPLSEEPLYGQMLRKTRPSLDTLASLELETWDRTGVALVTDPEQARKIPLPENTRYGDLMGSPKTWDFAIPMLGAPVCYISPKQASEQMIVALDGPTAWLPSDRDLKKILARGVLLDARAVEVLHQRGFGKYVGARVLRTMPHSTSAEIFHGNVLKAMDEKRMPLRLARNNWSELVPVDHARVLTTLIDPAGSRYPGTILFENTLGGRVVCYGGKNDLTDFHNHARVQWLNALLAWMSRDAFPLYVQTPQRILTIRKDRKKQTLLAFANMSSDPLEQVHCRLNGIKALKQVRTLSAKGEWIACKSTPLKAMTPATWELSLKTQIPIYQFLILLLDHQ